MSDSDSFFREVTEEVERDRMNRRLKKYGPYLAGVILLVVAAAAAWNWKKDQDRLAAEDRGLLLLSADPDAAVESAEVLSTGAAMLAEMRAADAAAASGNMADAVAKYDKVARTPGAEPVYADLAALRGLRLRAPSEPPEAIIALLTPLAETGRPYRLLALELRAALLMNAGKIEEAQDDMRAILDDPARTGNLDARIQQLFLSSGGNRGE
ncbi:MAG: hypothetical protein AAGD47_00560 [Pseudomonadota bacterium]